MKMVPFQYGYASAMLILTWTSKSSYSENRNKLFLQDASSDPLLNLKNIVDKAKYVGIFNENRKLKTDLRKQKSVYLESRK